MPGPHRNGEGQLRTFPRPQPRPPPAGPCPRPPLLPRECEGPTVDVGGDLPEDGEVRLVHDPPEDPVDPALIVDEDGLLGHPEGHDPHGQQEEEEEDVLHLQRQGGTALGPTAGLRPPPSAPAGHSAAASTHAAGARSQALWGDGPGAAPCPNGALGTHDVWEGLDVTMTHRGEQQGL